ncbi:hypothetical protein BpHYR1_009973 [Brachionus plicatilis]|uniref:Uncharacterized protein n=1 Tax=Brachionus plicatilis TaxID=10195 RepID=A0A3M7PW17_BRAPC|nr:hypothetical protein BpHYR1_009973 [Brachionus plicatilis]
MKLLVSQSWVSTKQLIIKDSKLRPSDFLIASQQQQMLKPTPIIQISFRLRNPWLVFLEKS